VTVWPWNGHWLYRSEAFQLLSVTVHNGQKHSNFYWLSVISVRWFFGSQSNGYWSCVNVGWSVKQSNIGQSSQTTLVHDDCDHLHSTLKFKVLRSMLIGNIPEDMKKTRISFKPALKSRAQLQEVRLQLWSWCYNDQILIFFCGILRR